MCSSQKTHIIFRKTLSWSLLSHNAFSIVNAALILAALHSNNFGPVQCKSPSVII